LHSNPKNNKHCNFNHKIKTTYLEIIASMKVKAGTRLTIAEANAGELNLIPEVINI